MRPRRFLLTVILIGSLTAMLALLVACSDLPGPIAQQDSPPAAREAPVERGEGLVEANDLTPASAQETPSPDGLSIVEIHCVRCHLVSELEQTEKSRAEWEQTLAKMGTFGLVLEDSEKTALLDDLAGPDEP